ncbi:MAG TPA: DUF1998 domain-containing protein [Chitinophagaceae bacterium]|nr:DUF1998 domain-containing protein [Chitinophagaceae bacterium]
MKILKQNQYNQAIGKYKLLSSSSGVGSIITTKLGFYVLISDINKWKFVKWANSKIELIRENNTDDTTIYRQSKNEISSRGLIFIDDLRFVKFLRREKELENLVCLIGIPHMALNETFNTPNWKNHPIKTALQKLEEQHEGVASHYMINGTHFPKWFKNKKGELKKLHEWYSIWKKECENNSDTLKLDYFAPPRDGNNFLREINSKNEDGNPIKIREYTILEQTNLVLICPNGHLSDIPWSNYLRWKTEKQLHLRPDEDKGENLLFNEMVSPCCPNPKLKWTESTTKSEGYASIFIECESCRLGSGLNANMPKINLEGITSLQPFCIGQKPWEIELEENSLIPAEPCFIRNDPSSGRERMRVALVTANNVYFASGFSSLYIPIHLAENKTQEIIDSILILEKKYQKYFERISISRGEYWDRKFNLEDFLIENDIHPKDEGEFYSQLKSEFLKSNDQEQNIDFHEDYRWQEFQCFSNNQSITDDPKNKGLKFFDTKLSQELKEYFTKIQQVEELKVTNVQLDFTRVKPKERVVINGVATKSLIGKNIFSIDSNELYVMPANETLGEGLFFQFSDDKMGKWIAEHFEVLKNRFSKYIANEPNPNSQGASLKRKIFNNGIKHFLIHSFSHMLMRELEFSCGYPTASLKERLYISTNPDKTMSGVLIYTAEGAEGSMGGLVSQGEPEKILQIILNGLERASQCSSDPLCWESDGQGIFDLNLAACFSCSLVSETACEEMNLGLDRRVLIDEQFGFFRNLFL